MRLARLSLAALTLVTLAACSNDATGPDAKPETVTPAGPQLNGQLFGSGGKATTDTIASSVGSGMAAGTTIYPAP